MSRIASILFCLGIALSAGLASADVVRVPEDAATIAAGLGAAAAGDTVRVAHGTWNERGLIMPDGVVLLGDPDRPDLVVVDAALVGRILDCVELGSATTVTGFTFRRGLAAGGSAIRCVDAPIRIADCVFEDNLAGFDAGAVVCDESDALIEDCVFTGNMAPSGNGGALVCRRSSPTVRGCEFTENSAFARGGAVYCSGEGRTPLLEKCSFTDNEGRYGGGVSVNGAAPTLVDCEFTGNEAAESGGAFYVGPAGEIEVVEGRFEGNAAPTGKIAVVSGGCTALLRCFDDDRSLVTGGGVVTWDDEGCDDVAADAVSWGGLKNAYR